METIRRGGVAVDPFGVGGFGQPSDWYYTRFVFAGDVKQAKDRVDAKYQSVNRDMQACSALPAGDRSAWTDAFTAWRKLYCRNDSGTCTAPDASWLNSGGEMDDVERAEKSLYDWQTKLKTKCAVSGPIEKPDATKREEGGPLNWFAEHKTALIVGGSVVGGVIVLGALAPYVKLLTAVVPRRQAT
jgi:hypothetical protein